MKREEFIFTIGYQGDTAVIDGHGCRKYGRLSTRELAEAGLYKAAFCSAVFSGKEEEQMLVLDLYNKASGASYKSVEDLKRLFGVFEIPERVQKTMYV